MAQFINPATLFVRPEDHQPTLPHRTVRISEELHSVVGYDPRTTQPDLVAVALSSVEPLPDGWWHTTCSTLYGRYNRTDLY